MSTSRGNVVDPWSVIDQHGADAFRWYYLSSQQPWAGYRFSSETVGESVRQFLLTLWNTYSFFVLYANAEEVELDQLELELASCSDLDRWALSRLQGLKRTVIERMDDFDCTTAGREISAYVDELSNWYVRLNRRRFWDGDRAALATLRQCLLELAALLAPFTPFVADELHANLSGEADSVHLGDYPEPNSELEDGELEAGVEAAMRAIELGRAARAQAKIKNRQPLRRAVIVATEAERSEIERLAELVQAELNVKELEFVSEEGELVSYAVKPNYRALGPRFGKSMPQVAAAVGALDPAHVADAVRGDRRIGINVEGAEHTLEPDDLTLAMQPLDGYEVEAEAGRAVALALELDEELVREGLAREIVHAIQNARKRAGLDVSDRISLTLGGDPGLVDAARTHEDYIAGETLAASVAYDGAELEVAASIEGRELGIGIEKR
jgi:isoleucyl-tRNA synthetase